MANYNVLDFGAVGDGKANDTPAVQKAIDGCARSGGGTVVAPAGHEFSCGTIELKSNVTFEIERGAKVIASPSREDYSEGRHQSTLFYARNAENFALTGGGEINGRGPHFMGEKLPHIYRTKGWRPFVIVILDSRNVTIRDVLIRQGACWTVTVDGCDDVVITGIRLINDDLIPNDDGIDICNSRAVRISDCYVKAGDDAIVIKSMPNRRGGETRPCEDVTVTGCTLESQSFALNIGCEAKAPMRNMVFDNIIVRNSHRGVGIHLSHGCDIENIIFSNMVVETRLYHPAWWGRGEPIFIVAIPWTHEDTIGKIRHVLFSNIFCRSENGVVIRGWEPSRIEDLVLENIRVELDSWSGMDGGQLDLRPYPGENPTENILVDHPTSGFMVKNATDVTLRNCRVAWGSNRRDYFRHALEADSAPGLRLEGFSGDAAWPEKYEAIVTTGAVSGKESKG